MQGATHAATLDWWQIQFPQHLSIQLKSHFFTGFSPGQIRHGRCRLSRVVGNPVFSRFACVLDQHFNTFSVPLGAFKPFRQGRNCPARVSVHTLINLHQKPAPVDRILRLRIHADNLVQHLIQCQREQAHRGLIYLKRILTLATAQYHLHTRRRTYRQFFKILGHRVATRTLLTNNRIEPEYIQNQHLLPGWTGFQFFHHPVKWYQGGWLRQIPLQWR